MMLLSPLKLILAVAVPLCALLIGWALNSAYQRGYAEAKADAEAIHLRSVATAVTQASNAVQTQVKNDLDKSNQTGRQREAKRAAIDHFFNSLDEAAHVPKSAVSPVDDSSCVLPSDRLQRWAAANAGADVDLPDHGAAASQPTGSAVGSTAPGDGAHRGLGVQPPRSGAGISPNSGAALRAAGVHQGEPK